MMAGFKILLYNILFFILYPFRTFTHFKLSRQNCQPKLSIVVVESTDWNLSCFSKSRNYSSIVLLFSALGSNVLLSGELHNFNAFTLGTINMIVLNWKHTNEYKSLLNYKHQGYMNKDDSSSGKFQAQVNRTRIVPCTTNDWIILAVKIRTARNITKVLGLRRPIIPYFFVNTLFRLFFASTLRSLCWCWDWDDQYKEPMANTEIILLGN